ncbi:MAG: MgtC/SapB family protein, partial [Firmicutes bacterium]|nr:MgtC/SapB family protein [Bacillota bacterium]
LVGLGAALFTLIGMYGFSEFSGDGPYRNMDPARIAAQIVTGVGFIGAGLIFKGDHEVRGLTTAATIWLTAALGTGIAAGMYTASAVAAALGFIALRLNPFLRRLGFDEPSE